MRYSSPRITRRGRHRALPSVRQQEPEREGDLVRRYRKENQRTKAGACDVTDPSEARVFVPFARLPDAA